MMATPSPGAGSPVTGYAPAGPANEMLVRAAERGDVTKVRELLEGGASPNSIACRRVGKFYGGSIQCKAGRAEPDFTYRGANFGPPKLTALQAAAGSGHLEIVEILITGGASINQSAPGPLGRTPLQAAAEGRHGGIVQRLLAAGAEINARASRMIGRTALQAASGAGDNEIVQILLGNGADVNAPASQYVGRTALQAAAEGGHKKIVEVLLKGGVHVNAPASVSGGRTALQAAAGGGHKEIVEVLLAAGADVNAPASGSFGRTALQAAANGGHKEIVEMLLAAGADVNAPASGYGRTALQAAAEGGHKEIVEVLLQANADLNCGGERTIFGLASTIDLVKLLINNKDANPDLRNDSGETGLHEAVRAGGEIWLKSLLDLNFFDMNARNPRGETALRIALQSGSPNVVYAPLLSKGASTAGLVVDMLPKRTPGEWTIILEETKTPGGMSVEWKEGGCYFELLYGEPRSIWLPE